MLLDTIIGHLQTAAKHATAAAQAIDATDHPTSEAHGIAQNEKPQASRSCRHG